MQECVPVCSRSVCVKINWKLICAVVWKLIRFCPRHAYVKIKWKLICRKRGCMKIKSILATICVCEKKLEINSQDARENQFGFGFILHIDWCCFYYFLRNSLVALLEALFARILAVYFIHLSRIIHISQENTLTLCCCCCFNSSSHAVSMHWHVDWSSSYHDVTKSISWVNKHPKTRGQEHNHRANRASRKATGLFVVK